MNKLLAISGSLRPAGNTDVLLERFAAGAESAGACVETVYLRNYSLNSCIGCEQCNGRGFCARFDDGMSLLYPLIEDSASIIMGSPVYNYNITSLTKAFIDRLFPYYIFTRDYPRQFSSRLEGQGRKAVIFAVGEQKSSRDMRLALPAMALPLKALGYELVDEILFRGFLRQGEVSANKKSLSLAFESGASLAKQT
jgi:multimeric flavodoxin WrbA